MKTMNDQEVIIESLKALGEKQEVIRLGTLDIIYL